MSQDPSSTDPLGSAWNFGKLMPGFGFLEQWTKGASAAMPSMGQWVAPTLDPAELEKRIQDLRTVQFWLEQNARMIGMTIQALEVQRMTLDTLKGMNVPVDALRESLKVRTPPAPEPSPAPAAAPSAAAPEAPEAPGAGSTEAGAAIDPMRWWGSLTKQFTDLAANTMQDALKTDGALAGVKKAAKAAKTAGAAKKAPASGRSKAAEAPRAARTRAAAASKTGTAKPGAAGKRPTPASGNASAED